MVQAVTNQEQVLELPELFCHQSMTEVTAEENGEAVEEQQQQQQQEEEQELYLPQDDEATGGEAPSPPPPPHGFNSYQFPC